MPQGTYQCRACARVWDGRELRRDREAPGVRWLCGDPACPASVAQISEQPRARLTGLALAEDLLAALTAAVLLALVALADRAPAFGRVVAGLALLGTLTSAGVIIADYRHRRFTRRGGETVRALPFA